MTLIAIPLLLCCIATDRAASEPPPGTQPSTQPLAKLTIDVVDLRSRKGQLIFGVFKSADGFPNKAKNSVNWQIRKIDAAHVVFTAELPPGKYSGSVLHDENNSGDMDKNFAGVPKEGYGVTNNPKPKLRPARFDEALFTLPPEGAKLTISVQYF